MSKPRELYRFVEGSNVWTFTSADTNQTHNSETYTSVTIGRNGIESRNELSKSSLTVTVALDSEIGQRWLRSVLSYSVSLTIFSKETLSTSVIWRGRLAAVKPEGASIGLVFESVFTSLRRPGLRARYQKNCRHAVYQRGCNLDMQDFGVEGLLTSVSNNVVRVPIAALQANGWYLGGVFESPIGDMRMIIQHNGEYLTLSQPIKLLGTYLSESGYGVNYGNWYGGVPVTIYPGCDRLQSTCISKFGNGPNYGGFRYIPSKNPFSGSSIV